MPALAGKTAVYKVEVQEVRERVLPALDAEFFKGTEYKSNFLCNLGYGDPAGVHPRSPRFAFDEMARIV